MSRKPDGETLSGFESAVDLEREIEEPEKVSRTNNFISTIH